MTDGRDRGASSVTGLLAAIAGTGRDATRGGYSRPAYSTAETELREWFTAEASRRGLAVERDANGILWAWWDLPATGDQRAESSDGADPRSDAVVTGSHLDSVPGGGAFDGPLGVASALAAFDDLAAREAAGTLDRRRPLALAVFPEEEGSAFGVACLGSRLLTGAIDPVRALNLRDADGTTFADASRARGLDPAAMGRDDTVLDRIGAFVELHVEQGRGLTDPAQVPVSVPVALGSSILGHGRWRLSIHGQGNHAGTTLMVDRADPMVVAAHVVLAVRETAAGTDGARATVGRITPVPGGTNVIASRVDLWLDVRHPADAVTAGLVAAIEDRAQRAAAAEGCTAMLTEESLSGTVHFDTTLTGRLAHALDAGGTGSRVHGPGGHGPGGHGSGGHGSGGSGGGPVPLLPTGAGHDAGVLAGHLPTAMLFVRNPSGISHAPEEHVEDDDAVAGARALADALAALLAEQGAP